jgi:5-oxoprolinase (ATP-hydrolysing)
MVVEAAAVEVIGRTETAADTVQAESTAATAIPAGRAPMYAAGQSHDTPVYDRDGLKPGMRVAGPAIIAEKNATTIIEPGWTAEVTTRDHLVIRRTTALRRESAVGTQVDPVMLEVFNNLFMSIAEQMGVALQNTAYSVNIKERLDFSCALFDRDGALIANAPHMPVHLGSMGESVAAVKRARGNSMRPGDVFMLNAPYNGGTHLPDVTVVTPVFDGAGPSSEKGEILFFVASRGHQADIGGITPGSMPPDSTTVEEEGVLIDNFMLVEQGHFRETETVALLSAGKYPSRNPAQNIGDLKAQIAACEKGVQELRKMVAQFGLEVVQAYMRHVQDNAEEQVRRVLGVLKDGAFSYEMDDGSVIRARVSFDKVKRTGIIDFTGTSPQRPTNFNAPSAVCMAAVLYVFRTLIEDEIPMNAGVLKPLEVIIPEGSMLAPRYPAAVVAGNVETSQCVTDALYGALGVLSGAQGTMNNFTFGNDRHQYYETICGGSGAGPDFDGCDAVHTHMTNSRLTDPEVLEWRFPVLVESFAIRRGSGGGGAHRGGDGAVRRIRFLEAMSCAILANRRRVAPFGLAGGEPGKLGRNWVERVGGRIDEKGATARWDVGPGDVFVIETPGGGGFGRA